MSRVICGLLSALLVLFSSAAFSSDVYRYQPSSGTNCSSGGIYFAAVPYDFSIVKEASLKAVSATFPGGKDFEVGNCSGNMYCSVSGKAPHPTWGFSAFSGSCSWVQSQKIACDPGTHISVWDAGCVPDCSAGEEEDAYGKCVPKQCEEGKTLDDSGNCVSEGGGGDSGGGDSGGGGGSCGVLVVLPSGTCKSRIPCVGDNYVLFDSLVGPVCSGSGSGDGAGTCDDGQGNGCGGSGNPGDGGGSDGTGGSDGDGGGSDGTGGSDGDGGGSGGTGGSDGDGDGDGDGSGGDGKVGIDETGVRRGIGDLLSGALGDLDDLGKDFTNALDDQTRVDSLPWSFNFSLPATVCTPLQWSVLGREQTFDPCPLLGKVREALSFLLAGFCLIYLWRSATSAVGGGAR